VKTQLQIAIEREQSNNILGGSIEKTQGIPNFEPSYFYGTFRMSEGQTQSFDEKKPYAGHSWVYICSHKIATVLKRIPHKLAKRTDNTDKEEHIYKHEILDSLRKPNPWQTRTTFWESIVLSLMLPTLRSTGGQVFLIPSKLNGEKCDLHKGEIPDLWFPYDDNWVSPKIENGVFKNWRWQPPNAKTGSEEGALYYEQNELIRIYNLNPYDSLRGMAPFVPVKFAVMQDSEASQFNYHFFKNNATLSGILTGDQHLSPAQRSELAKSWNELYSGSHKAGSVAVLGNGLKFQEVTRSHLDMQFSEMKAINKDEVVAAYGLNELAFAQLKSIPYTNVVEGVKMLWYDTYLPVQDNILEAINTQWVEYIDPSLLLESDLSEIQALKADLEQRTRIAAQMITAMQIPTAEAVRIVGIDVNVDDYPWMKEKPIIGNPALPGMEPAAPKEESKMVKKSCCGASGEKKEIDEKHTQRNAVIADSFCKMVLDPGERRMQKMFVRLFSDQRNEMLDKVDTWAKTKKAIEKITETPSPEIFLFDLKQANEETISQYKPQVKNQMNRVATALKEELPNGLVSWSVTDESTQAFVALRREIVEGINTTNFDLARDEIEQAISEAFDEGLTVQETAKRIKDSVFDATQVRINNAVTIARTEIGSVTQMTRLEAFKAEEIEWWEWITARDNDVRESHMIDGEIQEVGKSFSNGLKMPLDPDGDAEDVINCRCVTVYSNKGE